jgi:DNA-binding Lrp family transcriptional regulator
MTVVETERSGLDAVDRRLLVATQGGLPLVPRPYHALADRLDIAPEEVMRRMRRLLERGVIRRIAAVPDHYALGYRANGMSVWDVDDARVDELGCEVGALPFVSHCYRRPRVLPDWPYNLFAMVHAATRLEVAERVATIASLLGDAARSYDILFSTRILKKTGMRLGSRRDV